MGFVFGLARGLLVVGLGYLVFASLAPPKNASRLGARGADCCPIVKGTADVIRSLSGGKAKKPSDDSRRKKKPAESRNRPKSPTKTTRNRRKNQAGAPKSPATQKEGSGEKSKSYDAGERRALDQLVRSTSKP